MPSTLVLPEMRNPGGKSWSHALECSMAIELGKLGIWRHYSGVDAKFAAEAEKLGYGAIWLGGSPGGDLEYVDDLLGATESLVVATGIVNIWQDEPASIAK